jgi:hypothetical protein
LRPPADAAAHHAQQTRVVDEILCSDIRVGIEIPANNA